MYCPLTTRQKLLYQAVKNKISIEDLLQSASSNTSQAQSSTSSLMNLVMQFRKVQTSLLFLKVTKVRMSQSAKCTQLDVLCSYVLRSQCSSGVIIRCTCVACRFGHCLLIPSSFKACSHRLCTPGDLSQQLLMRIQQQEAEHMSSIRTCFHWSGLFCLTGVQPPGVVRAARDSIPVSHEAGRLRGSETRLQGR